MYTLCPSWRFDLMSLRINLRRVTINCMCSIAQQTTHIYNGYPKWSTSHVISKLDRVYTTLYHESGLARNLMFNGLSSMFCYLHILHFYFMGQSGSSCLFICYQYIYYITLYSEVDFGKGQHLAYGLNLNYRKWWWPICIINLPWRSQELLLTKSWKF